jgi:YidC/Oxa1 family membrane protein insertase
MMITLPIYTIIHRLISTVRPIKATHLFNVWNFALNPLSELFKGHWVYLGFLAIIMPCQALSMFLPRIWAKKRSRNATAISSKGTKQARFTNIIQTVVLCVMCFIVANSPTGVGLYWFLSSLFSIGQAWVMHTLILRNRINHGSLEKKLEKLGLE